MDIPVPEDKADRPRRLDMVIRPLAMGSGWRQLLDRMDPGDSLAVNVFSDAGRIGGLFFDALPGEVESTPRSTYILEILRAFGQDDALQMGRRISPADAYAVYHGGNLYAAPARRRGDAVVLECSEEPLPLIDQAALQQSLV